jgi:hypothetical protein
MITEKERQFLRYWEQNRDSENSFISKLAKGLPMATLFGLPIILSVIIVRLYFPEWYTKISQTTPGMFLTAIIAVIGIILFTSYFNMQYRWETNDQAYQELIFKEKKEQEAKAASERKDQQT